MQLDGDALYDPEASFNCFQFNRITGSQPDLAFAGAEKVTRHIADRRAR
jgi:hypothetical protein